MPQPPFWTIARKDVRVLFRDRTALIFIFGLPLIFTGIFGAIAGGGNSKDSKQNPLKVLVANEDRGKEGAAVVEAMRQVGLSVEAGKGPADVEARIRKGEHPIGLVIAPDFTERLSKAAEQVVSGAAKPEQAHLKVLTDPAQSQIAGMAQGAIFAATQRASAPLYRAATLARVPEEFRSYAEKNMGLGSGNTSAVAIDVTEMSAAKSGTPEPTAGDRLLPGFAIYFIFFLANSVAVALLTERQEGTLRRMLSAPLAASQILLGKMLARGYFGLLQVAMMYSVGVFTLHFTFGANPLGQILVVLICIFSATGLGMLIATMGRTPEQIQGMTTLTLLLMGFISGTLIPRSVLPDSMIKLGMITPHYWALNAYQDILLRRMPLTSTLPNLGVLLLFGLVFYGVALARFRYE